MPLTLDDILEYISRGHAYAKHVEGMGQPGEAMEGVNSFRDVDTAASPLSQAGRAQALGPSIPINNPADLKDYLQKMIDSPATEGFVTGSDRNIIHLFNSRDQTYMVINTLDPDFGTVMRYPKSRDQFKNNATLAQQRGEFYTQFDNSKVQGAAADQIDNLIQRTTNPIALREPPGAWASRQAQYSGSNHLSNAPMSADYQKFATHLEDMKTIRHGMDFGSGFVAAVDDKGRPSQMFLLDETANTVTEINGREITIHSFETIPEAQRAEVAQQFLEMNRPPNQEIIDGGYNEIVNSFQSENTGKLPLSGSNTQSVMSNIDKGTVETLTETPYRSFGDASRAYIGFTDDQARLFDLIPAEISAETLKQIEDTAIRNALGDLTTAKGYAQIGDGEEVVEGLRMFAETFEGLDDATRAGVLDVAAAAAKSPAADMAQGSAAAIDALDGASDLAKMVSSLKAGRLGLNVTKAGVITTVAATTLAVSATAYANTVIEDIADQLYASGDLTEAAHKDFKELMSDVGPMLTGQAADPFITAIPGMAIVERIAYNKFQDFSDKHKLPQNIHEMLSPSIVAGTSLRGEIGQDSFRMIPDDPANAPDSLKGLVNARNAQLTANDNYWDTYQENRPPVWQAALMDSGMGMYGGFGKPPSQQITEMTPDVIAAQETLDTAKRNFQTEFDNVLANPEGARALADLMDEDQLFEIVKQTAKYNVEGQDPLIQNYVEAQAADAAWYDLKGAWNNWRARDNAEEALRENPEVMREYLSNIFVPKTSPEPAPEVEREPIEIGSIDRERLEEDPNYMMVAGAFEKQAEGGTLDQYDQEQIQSFVDNATTLEQMSVVSMLRERYPSEMDPFLQASANDADGAVEPGVSTPDVTLGTTMAGTRL